MSSVASLYNVPTTDDEFSTFSFIHQVHHLEIAQAIRLKGGPQLPLFILDPFDPDDMQQWLDQHQTLHNVQNAYLGISGFNLDSVTWQDQNQRAGWVWFNSQEHLQAADKLGIG